MDIIGVSGWAWDADELMLNGKTDLSAPRSAICALLSLLSQV